MPRSGGCRGLLPRRTEPCLLTRLEERRLCRLQPKPHQLPGGEKPLREASWQRSSLSSYGHQLPSQHQQASPCGHRWSEWARRPPWDWPGSPGWGWSCFPLPWGSRHAAPWQRDRSCGPGAMAVVAATAAAPSPAPTQRRQPESCGEQYPPRPKHTWPPQRPDRQTERERDPPPSRAGSARYCGNDNGPRLFTPARGPLLNSVQKETCARAPPLPVARPGGG